MGKQKTLQELVQELEDLKNSPIPEDQKEFNLRLDKKNELENQIKNYEWTDADYESINNNIDLKTAVDYAINNQIERGNLKVSEAGPGIISPESAQLPKESPSSRPGPASEPFRILGVGDDGRAAFITEEGRLMKWNLDSLSKNKLLVLAGQPYWLNEYHQKKGVDWDEAIDYLIRVSQVKDFNEQNIRGRGAWHDGDEITYHDGINTIGWQDPRKIYLRLPRHDIGIQDDPINRKITKEIKKIIFKMSFETPADVVRCLGWSVLAPFAGALKYRPALLLTGPSGSGKTTVANLCIRKLANCEWFNGSESTVAGVRGKIRYDSCGIMFEEVEADTPHKKANRDDLFSLMRVNVSDDAPDTVKGTKEGGYNSFKMQNMFGFIAVDPTVEQIADENRIFRVNMIRPKNQHEWKKIELELKELLTNDNCRAIRALTWQKLRIILDLSEKVVDLIREKTGRDQRSSYSDAMLASAFIVIFNNTDNPTDKQLTDMLDKYYSYQPAEEHRDEAEEIIERLMNEVIEVLHGHDREKLTIMECLNRIYTGKRKIDNVIYDLEDKEIDDYKLSVARYGIKLTSEYEVAIQNNHHIVKKIIERGNGYSKILKRHWGCIDSQRNVHFFDGKSPRCTILRGIIEKEWGDKTDEEKLGDIIV